MDFEFTEEQKQVKALIKEFFEKEVSLKELNDLSDRATAAKTVEEVRAIYPKEMMRKLHEIGLRQLCVPERYGGGGFDRGGYMMRAVAAEQAGYSMGVAARLLGLPWMHTTGVAQDQQATEPQKEWFFSKFMSDPCYLTATSSTEPSGNTDLILGFDDPPGTTMKTFAHKDGDTWVLNGDKMYCSGGAAAELIHIGARTKKEGHFWESTGSFWVPRDTPGMQYTLNRLTLAEIPGNVQIYMDNVRVPESDMAATVRGSRRKLAGTGVPKMLVYIDILGHAERVYEQIVEYAKQRIGGGRPIIQHTHVAALLGEAALNLEEAKQFAYRASWENDQAELNGKVILSNFWTIGTFHNCKKAAWRVVELATEVYGGVAGTFDLDAERFARRVFVWLPVGLSPKLNAIQASMSYNDHTIAEFVPRYQAGAKV